MIKKIIKSVAVIITFVALLAGVLAILYWSPDLSTEYIEDKYGSVDSQFLELESGDRLHFRDQGNKIGPVLLLIHGTSSSLHTWDPLIDSLDDSFRLVSFDLPGHGLTGEFRRRDYSENSMVSTALALLDHLNIDQATVVGNSLGGRVAVNIAILQPSRVNSLVLIAPGGAKRLRQSESNIGFRILKTEIGQSLLQSITPRFLIKRSLEQTIYDKNLVTSRLVDRYWELLRKEGNRRAIVDLAKLGVPILPFKQMTNLSNPVLLVWGKGDKILPPEMIRQFESALVVSQSVLYDDIGHLPQLEAVDTLSKRLISFCKAQNC